MQKRNILIALLIISLAVIAFLIITHKPRTTPPSKTEKETTSTPIPEEEASSFPENFRQVYVFFQSSNGPFLVPEKRRIFATNSITDQAKQALGELIKGPEIAGHLPTVPRRTRINELYLSPYGTAFVDLSSEFATGQAGGTEEELMAVYSIVNTLTINFPSIRRVKFLINGRERDTLRGHLSLKHPFTKNTELLSKQGAGFDGGKD